MPAIEAFTDIDVSLDLTTSDLEFKSLHVEQ